MLVCSFCGGSALALPMKVFGELTVRQWKQARVVDWDTAVRGRWQETPRRWLVRSAFSSPRRSASRRQGEVVETGSRLRREQRDNIRTSDASAAWSRRQTPAGCPETRQRTRLEWHSGLPVKTPERRWRRSPVASVEFCWWAQLRLMIARRRYRSSPCQQTPAAEADSLTGQSHRRWVSS